MSDGQKKSNFIGSSALELGRRAQVGWTLQKTFTDRTSSHTYLPNFSKGCPPLAYIQSCANLWLTAVYCACDVIPVLLTVVFWIVNTQVDLVRFITSPLIYYNVVYVVSVLRVAYVYWRITNKISIQSSYASGRHTPDILDRPQSKTILRFKWPIDFFQVGNSKT